MSQVCRIRNFIGDICEGDATKACFKVMEDIKERERGRGGGTGKAEIHIFYFKLAKLGYCQELLKRSINDHDSALATYISLLKRISYM